MKQTIADRQYASLFGAALVPHYERLVQNGNETPKGFAQSLGVTTGALQKYLKGASMPSLRTVIRAYDAFGVLVPYEGRELANFAKRSRKRQKLAVEYQLDLPLTVACSTADITCKVAKKNADGFRLNLQIRKAV
jgi:transcriptional regulator with XRE-family HTH domain